MAVYIRNISSINACGDFDTAVRGKLNDTSCTLRQTAIEPDYKAIISDAGLRRRMSHFIKMGVASGLQCLMGYGDERLDAIITATGFGGIEDTRKFLQSIYDSGEQLMNPTSFIQSTFNTVGAQLALLVRCNEYNMTYVHRGLSFESALVDTQLLLTEGAKNVLVGGIDELTDETFDVLQRSGWWKEEQQCISLYDSDTKGTVAGEGAQFALLSSTSSTKDFAVLQGVRVFSNVERDMLLSALSLLEEHKLHQSDVDMLLLGENGDYHQSEYYSAVKNEFSHANVNRFKHLCGEYPTASSFAFWLAVNLVNAGEAKRILLCNHYGASDGSVMLITAP